MSGWTDWLTAVGSYVAASAVAHLLWEIVQLPLYTIGQTGTVGARAFAVVHCTGGDIIIATWTLFGALVLAGHRTWPHGERIVVALATVALALLFTGYSEWRNVSVKQAWAYTPMMPTLRLGDIAIGLAPLAQWIAVPAVAFLWTYRQMRQ